MNLYTWTPQSGFESKADANKVGLELENIGDNIRPEQVLEKGRDETTELHKCFEWDDEKAAEQYRLRQARQIMENIKFITVNPTQEDSEPKEIRLYYHVPDTPGYTKTTYILQNENKYQLLLEQAHRELRAFKNKYQSLTELKPIFDLID